MLNNGADIVELKEQFVVVNDTGILKNGLK